MALAASEVKIALGAADEVVLISAVVIWPAVEDSDAPAAPDRVSAAVAGSPAAA